MWHKHSSLSCCLKPDPYFVVQAQYQASPMLACKQRTTERLTWWSAAQHQTSPDCCGAVCWPGGRGSGTRVPAGATSAGPSAQRTSALANTEPSGEGKMNLSCYISTWFCCFWQWCTGQHTVAGLVSLFPTFWHFWMFSSAVSVVCSADRMYLFRVLSRARSFRQGVERMLPHNRMLSSSCTGSKVRL